ncbi:MAG: hypothetical protein AUJ98_07565 [Bacteroidetes bacterium CG2_30_33_31]|nr:MAG: hypothetical protein AUJ98_07565 [Bacteroidetes bacterium CG2_30_33_31]
MTIKRNAIVLGATGLVGRKLVELLVNDESFSNIKLIVRRNSGFSHPKIQEEIVDFNNINSYKSILNGDILFSCMGTTLKQAGGKKEQYKVDFTYQYEVAKAASENRVADYVLVSSASASYKSNFFYTKTKGELEEAIKKLPFIHINIIRPSVLMGKREQSRAGEIFGANLINFLGKLIPPLKKYRGIKAEEVALALINSQKLASDNKLQIYELAEVFELLKN